MRAPPESSSADHRDAALLRQLHDLADLVRLHLGEGAAQDGEILGVDGHAAAVDLAEAGDHAVAGILLVGHAEVADVVRRQPAELLEAAAVQQQVDALARCQLALGVLIGDSLFAAAQLGPGPHLAEFFEFVFHLCAPAFPDGPTKRQPRFLPTAPCVL